MNDTNKETEKKVTNKRKARYYYFAMILYVDEDIRHQKVFDYISANYSYAYILHDSDVDDNGEIKKSHIHLVYKSLSQSTEKSQLESFGGYISHVEGINNILSYYKYLTHTDFKSQIEEKHVYKLTDIQGDLQISPTMKSNYDSKSLIQFIETSAFTLTMLDLANYAMTISDDALQEVKIRNMFYYNLIKEHNYHIQVMDNDFREYKF